jgi:hypothetical protein
VRRFIYTAIDRFIVVLFVFLFSQLPLFMYDYEIRLSGHVSESKRFLNELQLNAQSADKTLTEYIQKFIQQRDSDFSSHGNLLKRTVDRHNDLSAALTALLNATIFTKPFLFVRHLQMDIFYETIKSFQAGFSFTIETIFYSLMGLLFGMWAANLLVSRKLKALQAKASQ